MGTEREVPDLAREWYLHFNARFSNNIYDHEDREDHREMILKAAALIDEWEEMSRHLPIELRAQSAYDMFIDCVGMKDGLAPHSSVFSSLTQPCARCLMESADGLSRQQRRIFAIRVAQMSEGNFDSPLLHSIIIGLVDRLSLEEVLDIVGSGLRSRYRYSEDIIIEAVDCQYREFAERLIEAAGRSIRGRLKGKLTIVIH